MDHRLLGTAWKCSRGRLTEKGSLLIDFQVEPADGLAERRAAVAMADERLADRRRITLGGDKGYRRVRLYQAVTLAAKSFQVGEEGGVVKGVP
jgi:hypothetical protein